jgi:hypothetical protein
MNYPDEFKWRGLTFKRNSPEDMHLGHWHCECWGVWVDLIAPDPKHGYSPRWYAGWQVGAVQASSLGNGKSFYDSYQAALDACYRDLTESSQRAAKKMEELSRQMTELARGVWAAQRDLTPIDLDVILSIFKESGEPTCDPSASQQLPATSGEESTSR